jgi:V/A-type H+/Na+-transporting ATPase subunit E
LGAAYIVLSEALSRSKMKIKIYAGCYIVVNRHGKDAQDAKSNNIKEVKMDIQLNELIEKIKKEGVGEAENRANQIIDDANKQASEIVEKAKKEAAEMVARARADQQQFEAAGKETVKQAGRDLILNIKASLTSIFDSVIKREVSAGLSEDVVAELVPVIIKEWMNKNTDKIEVLLSKEDSVKLEQTLLSKLSAEMKKGIEVKAHPNIKSGFRIAEKNGDSYYDFTSEGIAESLIQHLNPVLGEIIMKAAAE